MGFVSNSLNFRGLGYQGKHQIYFLFRPFDFGHLPTKKCVPFTNTSRSCAAICDVWNKHKRVCLKLEYPQISWMRWVSCSRLNCNFVVCGIPVYPRSDTPRSDWDSSCWMQKGCSWAGGARCHQRWGRWTRARAVCSAAIASKTLAGPLLLSNQVSSCQVQPSLVGWGSGKHCQTVGWLIIICPSIGCLKAVRAGLQSTNWGISSNQNDSGIHWRYLQCTTWKFSWSQFKRTVAADRRTPNFRPCCWVTTKPGQISSGCHWIALDGGS